MRKIIWFSIVFLVLIFLCMPGLADEDWTYRIEEGLAYLTAYTGSEPEVTVPQDVDGFPVFGLDKDSVPTFVEKITVPVAVSAIADNAMHEGIAVQALHGAYALQWAEEHHCQATDLSKPGFTSLIVDLTGSDYRQTADGYSLGPALGKSLSSEVAIYLPETGKAWGIIKLTRQGDRYLAEVVEADVLLTYEQVIITNRGKSRGVSIDSNGVATVTFQSSKEHRLALRANNNLIGSITPYMIIRDLDVNIELDIAALDLSYRAAVAGWNLGAIISGQPEYVIESRKFVKSCYVHGEFDLGISFTVLPESLVGELEITGPVLPFGTTGLVLAPFALFQYDFQRTINADLGYEHIAFTIDYSKASGDEHMDGGVSNGTPYFRSPCIADGAFAVNYGVAVDYNAKVASFTLAEVVQNLSFTTEVKDAVIKEYKGTSKCHDVTWTVERSVQLTFNPGIDFKPWKSKTFKMNAYAQWEHKFSDDFYVGATAGSHTSVYMTKEIAKELIPWPRLIYNGYDETKNYILESGETAHFEMDQEGKWHKVESCQRQHALHFEPNTEGVEPFDIDCSEFSYGSQWQQCNTQLTSPGRSFDGWYTDEGELFFDNASNYTEPYDWNGTRTLTAHWSEQQPDDEDFSESYYYTYGDYPGQGYSYYQEKPTLMDWWLWKENEPGVPEYLYLVAYNIENPVDYAYREYANSSYNPGTGYDIDFHDYPVVVDGMGSRYLTQLVLDSKVAKVSSYAGCPELRTVIGNGHLEDLGIFTACPQLENITGIEGINQIRPMAFGNCYALKAFPLPDTVHTIGEYAFANCHLLKDITLPASLKIISNYAFANCTSLSHLTLPGGLTDYGIYVFKNCSSLAHVDFSEGITKIGYGAFANSGITSVSLPSTVKEIEDCAFENCAALETVSIPYHLNRIGSLAFSGCSKLVEFSADAEQVEEAFFGCTNLKNVTLNNVKALEADFSDTPNLETVHITCTDDCSFPDNISSWLSNMFSRSGVKELSISGPSRIPSLSLFDSMTELEKLTLQADNIGYIDLTSLPNLKQLTIIAEENISGITLSSCPELTEVNIQCESCESLNISNCNLLDNLEVPGKLNGATLRNCQKIKEIHFNSLNNLSVSNLAQLEYLELADGAATWNSDWSASIFNCPNLKAVITPMDADTGKINLSNCPNARFARRADSVSAGNATVVMHISGVYGQESDDLLLVPGTTFKLFAARWAKYYYNTFRGWVLNGDTNHLLQAGDTIIVPAEESTLYAIYDQNFTSIDIQDGVLYGYIRNTWDSSTYLTIPDEVTGLAANCVSATETSVYIGHNVSSVDPLAFAQAENLQVIEVDEKNPWFYAVDGILYSKTGALVAVPAATPVTEYSVPEGITAIGAHAFNGELGRLINVVISEQVTSLGDNWYSGILYCSVYGPMEGPVADSAAAAGLNYNVFPVYFISQNQCIAVASAQAGTVLPDLRNLRDDGSFMGWSLSETGNPLDGPVTVPYGGLILYARWSADPPLVPDFILPNRLEIVEEEAFAQLKMSSVRIPASVRKLMPRIFSGCNQLSTVYIEGMDTIIDAAAFEGTPVNLVIYGYTGSTAESFATDQGIRFIALDR